MAERIREQVDPETIIRRAVAVLENGTDRDAMVAAVFLSDRGWLKPPQQLELDAAIHPPAATAFNLDALDADEQRLILGVLRKARTALSEPTSPIDDEDAA